jgi:hypothetical protein
MNEPIEVLNDSDGRSRVEIRTNGTKLEIGHDIEAGASITFPVGAENSENWYDKIRYGSHPSKFSVPSETGSQSVLVDGGGISGTRVFAGDRLAFKDGDHELSTIRTAFKKARQQRIDNDEFDYEERAREYVEDLLPSYFNIEQTKYSKQRQEVWFEATDDTGIIDENQVLSYTLDPHISNASMDAEDGDTIYSLTVNAGSIKDADQNGPSAERTMEVTVSESAVEVGELTAFLYNTVGVESVSIIDE